MFSNAQYWNSFSYNNFFFFFFLMQITITLCSIREHDWPFPWTSDDSLLKTFFKEKIKCQHVKFNDQIWAVGTSSLLEKKPGCCLLLLCFSQEKNIKAVGKVWCILRSSALDELCPAAMATALIYWSAWFLQLCWQQGMLTHCSQRNYWSSEISSANRDANRIKSFSYIVCRHFLWCLNSCRVGRGT